MVRISRTYYLGILLACIGLPLQLWAQAPVQQPGPGLRLSFVRQNNFTYSTRADLNYRFIQGKYSFELRLHHDNLYISNRLDNPFVQVYLRTDLWQYYRIDAEWEAVSWLKTNQFFNSDNLRYNLYLGARYVKEGLFSITPLIGYSWDLRSGLWNQGLSPGLIFDSRYQWPDGLTMETRAHARAKYIMPRHQRNVSLRSDWGKSFNEAAAFSFGLAAGSNEIDNLRGAPGLQPSADTLVVERIFSDTLSPYLNMRYRIGPKLYWDSRNQLAFARRKFAYEYNNIERNRDDLQFRHLQIFSNQKLSFSRKKLNGYLGLTYQYVNRRYDLENSRARNSNLFLPELARERQKDFFRRMIQWDWVLNYQFKPRHRSSLALFNRYVQYDTPSEENFNDHDELNYGFTWEVVSAWSRRFSTNYKVLGSVRQYAFLLQERSQDNYTQYNLRLNFGFRWAMLDRLSMRGQQFIYVNYNVKDFTDINLTDRSTRNLETRIDVDYRPNNRWDLNLSFYRKEIHVSYLNWAAFTETPLDTTTTYIVEESNQYLLKQGKKSNWYLDLGMKHFSQSRKFNTTMTDLEGFLVPINLRTLNIQTGPKTGIRVLRREPATLNLSVWWQVQLQDFRFKEIARLSSVSSAFRQQELEKVQVNFRPFLNLEINLWLNSL